MVDYLQFININQVYECINYVNFTYSSKIYVFV